MSGKVDRRGERRERVVAQSPWLRGVVELAAYIRRSEMEATRLVNTGEIPSYLEEGHSHGILVNKADVDAYVRSLPSGSKLHPALREVAA